VGKTARESPSLGLAQDRSFFSKDGKAVISLKVQNVTQLFSTMDPAPLSNKSLDSSVEEWIVSSATEAARHASLELQIHVQNPAEATPSQAMVQEAVRLFFAYKSQLSRRELSQVFKKGRISLLIGLTFLGVTLAISKMLGAFETNRMALLIRESLIIGGWVAMWRPLEILLYDWWPIRNQRIIFDRLSATDVTLLQDQESTMTTHLVRPA